MSLSMKEQMENLSAEEKATRLKSFKERMGDIPFATRGLDDYKIYGYIEVYEAAVRNGAKFPDVIATQWALESGWGEKQSGDNNYFGIKARDGEKYKLVDTLENIDGKGNKPTKEKFRSYDSLDEAIQDRISRPHWKRAEERSETAEDYINYLTFISNYATDDEYDVKMKQTLNSRHKYGLEYGERGNGAISKANRKAAYMERLAAIDGNKSSADAINEGYGQLAGNLNTAANSLPDFVAGKQDMVAKAEEFTTTAEQFDTSTRKDVTTPKMLSSMNPNLPNAANYSEFDKTKIFNTVNPDSELAQMDDQTKKLNNEREVAFNFTGSPTLNAKTLLAPKKQSKFGGKMFKDGGALTEFNEGGTHEENPLGGIPQGQGNLVEEGETKYNDYIFSNSLYLSKEDVKEARLDPKLAGKTIAEASKYINRFLDEAPYDKITRDTVNDQLDQLMLINERMLTAHQAEEESLMANDPAVQEGMALQEEMQAMEQMQGMEGQDPMSQGGIPSPEEMMMQEQPGMFNFGGGLNFNTDLTSRSPFIDYDGQAYGNGQGSMRVPSGIMEPTTIGSDLANNTNAAAKSAKLQQGVSKGLAAGAGVMGVIDNFSGENLSGNALQDGLGSTMSGASAGMAFGPVGAAVGGGLGLISGLVGSNSKRKKLERAKNNAISNEFNSGFVGEKLTFAKGGSLKRSKAYNDYNSVNLNSTTTGSIKRVAQDILVKQGIPLDSTAISNIDKIADKVRSGAGRYAQFKVQDLRDIVAHYYPDLKDVDMYDSFTATFGETYNPKNKSTTNITTTKNNVDSKYAHNNYESVKLGNNTKKEIRDIVTNAIRGSKGKLTSSDKENIDKIVNNTYKDAVWKNSYHPSDIYNQLSRYYDNVDKGLIYTPNNTSSIVNIPASDNAMLNQDYSYNAYDSKQLSDSSKDDIRNLVEKTLTGNGLKLEEIDSGLINNIVDNVYKDAIRTNGYHPADVYNQINREFPNLDRNPLYREFVGGNTSSVMSPTMTIGGKEIISPSVGMFRSSSDSLTNPIIRSGVNDSLMRADSLMRNDSLGTADSVFNPTSLMQPIDSTSINRTISDTLNNSTMNDPLGYMQNRNKQHAIQLQNGYFGRTQMPYIETLGKADPGKTYREEIAPEIERKHREEQERIKLEEEAKLKEEREASNKLWGNVADTRHINDLQDINLTGAQKRLFDVIGNFDPSANVETESTFTPRNNFGVNAVNAAPVVGSFFDMVNKEKADPVSYQTSSFKYDPTFMDESVLQNNIRQASANTLRSMEQSGMSAGQMAAAKLATGATEMQGMNDAYMNVNQHNAAERSKMQDVDMRRNDFNISMSNKQIEDNLAGQAAATAQNRADRTNFYNNISQLGKQLGDENKAYNLTRGYTADGRYRPENMFKDYLNVFKGKPVERKAGGNLNSIFEDSKANSVALMNLLIQNMTNNGK